MDLIVSTSFKPNCMKEDFKLWLLEMVYYMKPKYTSLPHILV
jgi:hypothetical protein